VRKISAKLYKIPLKGSGKRGIFLQRFWPPGKSLEENFKFSPLKIPPTLKYSTIWRNFVCGGKNFLQKFPPKKFPTLNINGLINFRKNNSL